MKKIPHTLYLLRQEFKAVNSYVLVSTIVSDVGTLNVLVARLVYVITDKSQVRFHQLKFTLATLRETSVNMRPAHHVGTGVEVWDAARLGSDI